MLYIHCGGLSIHVVCLNKHVYQTEVIIQGKCKKKKLSNARHLGKSASLCFLFFKIISAAETLDISNCCDRLYSVSNLIGNSGPHPHAVSEISDILTSGEWVTSWDVAACVCGTEFHIVPLHLNGGAQIKVLRCEGRTPITFFLPINALRCEISPVQNAQSQMFTGEKERREMRLLVLCGLEWWTRV